MKKKQKDEIKAKSIGELKKLIKDSDNLLFKLRLEKSQNKLKNLREIFNERKKVALAQTLINEKAKMGELAKKEEKSESVKGGSKK